MGTDAMVGTCLYTAAVVGIFPGQCYANRFSYKVVSEYVKKYDKSREVLCVECDRAIDLYSQFFCGYGFNMDN